MIYMFSQKLFTIINFIYFCLCDLTKYNEQLNMLIFHLSENFDTIYHYLCEILYSFVLFYFPDFPLALSFSFSKFPLLVPLFLTNNEILEFLRTSSHLPPHPFHHHLIYSTVQIYMSKYVSPFFSPVPSSNSLIFLQSHLQWLLLLAIAVKQITPNLRGLKHTELLLLKNLWA